MLERMQDAPAHTLALKASGTIMARDVESAIEAALDSSNAATGLVIAVEREFDGYFAELSPGLANVSHSHRNLVRLAVLTEADRMDEAKLGGLGFCGSHSAFRRLARGLRFGRTRSSADDFSRQLARIFRA